MSEVDHDDRVRVIAYCNQVEFALTKAVYFSDGAEREDLAEALRLVLQRRARDTAVDA